ncbi:MAG TPA: hypothetical protein VIJ18_00810 [Microbacteriaceae bacterium]
MPTYGPMKPNASSTAGRAQANQPAAPPPPERVENARAMTPPARWEVVARPFGYLLVAVVWAALFAATLALPLLLPFGLRSDNPDYATSGFFDNMDLFVGILFGLFALVFLVPLFGYLFIALPLATGPLMVLSLTYVVRSLRPAYRTTRLSATGWSRESLGPITLYPVALSLIPQRATRWSQFWLGAALMGWRPSRGLLYAAAPCGLGYFLTVGWTMWPVHAPAPLTAWWIVTAVFAVATVILVVRDARLRYGLRRPATTAAAAS